MRWKIIDLPKGTQVCGVAQKDGRYRLPRSPITLTLSRPTRLLVPEGMTDLMGYAQLPHGDRPVKVLRLGDKRVA